MKLLPIDQLIFKGTHNSYQCIGECNFLGICDLDPPYMDHPPNVQIDDFGVWAVELDFSVTTTTDNPLPRAIVGHDKPHHGTCWGYYLTDFLTMIRNTLSMKYRPVFIYFDIKDWNDGEIGYSAAQKFEFAIGDVNQVFQGNYILLADYVDQHGGQYPALQDVVGKAVIYFPNPEWQFPKPDFPKRKGTLRGTSADHCTSRAAVESSISTGAPADDSGNSCAPEGCRVLRLDQYQADWTFEYGVPPNPLVVDAVASPPWTVSDSFGDTWSCDNGDVWKGQVVHEHGTSRFPYKTIGAAVFRAGGTTLNSVRDLRRAGYGWTVLIKPGNYAEAITIDIPLTLKKDDQFPGTVVIGQ